MSRYVVGIAVGIAGIIFLGCGTPEGTSTKPKSTTLEKSTTKSAQEKPTPEPQPKFEVAADAYADIPQAIAGLKNASVSGDQKELAKVIGWLILQGPAAVPPLREIMLNDQADAQIRITACRILGQLGPAAIDTLVAGLHNESQPIRINSAKHLANIKPTTRDELNKMVRPLIETLGHDDLNTRRYACKALASIGPPAKDAIEPLLKILKTENDATMRADANAAFKAINTRRTFVD